MLELKKELEKIKGSFSRISEIVYQTPVLSSISINKALKADITFKAECLQETGSFKLRGASSAISALSEEEKSRGVVAFSSGNHAQGIAYASRELGTSAKIVMPSDAPKIKIRKTQEYGAEVIFYDRDEDNREEIGFSIAMEEGRKLIKPNTKGLSANDKYIIEAMKILYDEFDLIVEPSGAIGLACILQNKEICQNKKVFTILSGGNIDANRYNELLGIDNG